VGVPGEGELVAVGVEKLKNAGLGGVGGLEPCAPSMDAEAPLI